MADEPIEGDIIPPEGSGPSSGEGDAKPEPPQKRAKRTSFTGRQSEEQRKDEDKRAAPFALVAARGEGWWKGDGWEPSGDDRLMVQMLKFAGYTDEQIGSALYMSHETLRKHFSWELDNAKTLIMGDLATRAYVRARQGNDIMTMFLLKTRSEGGAFSERTAQAAAISDSLKDAASLSDDKKAQVIASLLDLLNPKKEKSTTKKGDADESA